MQSDLDLLRRAVDDASRIIDGIPADKRSAPTPCPDFTAEQLVDHLAEGAAMFAAAVDGGEAAASAWKQAGDRLVTALSAPGALDGTIALPYGEFPGIAVLHQAIGEVAIHTCDLARATGQSIGDDAVYERVFDAVTDDWRVEGVLEPAVPCDDSAPLADRVLAFAGRKI
jgi:uncharacterized protein (TIGR03086 family)